MYASDIEILIGHGWANIALGNTLAEVRAALATNGHAYDLADDEFTLDIHTPEITFDFDNSEPKRLVQIVFYDPNHRVDSQPVIGLPLAQALLPLRPQSYDETLWSLVSIECEYQQGKPLENSQRLTRSTVEQNLSCATLWISSLGVGLVMLDDHVHAVAIRKIGQTPQVGCGHLDAKTLELSLQTKPTTDQSSTDRPYPKSPSTPSSPPVKSNRYKPHSVWITVLFFLLSITFLAIPGFIVYRDLTAWNDSRPVVGTVVDTKSDGPFLEEVIVEYTVADGNVRHRVTIPATYTTAQEIGKEVDLLYLPTRPDRAMTRIQIRDEGWSISPYLLIGSIGLAAFFLHCAFPNHIRLNSRRRSTG